MSYQVLHFGRGREEGNFRGLPKGSVTILRDAWLYTDLVRGYCPTVDFQSVGRSDQSAGNGRDGGNYYFLSARLSKIQAVIKVI